MTPSKALSIARTAVVFGANIARIDDGMLQEDVLAFLSDEAPEYHLSSLISHCIL
jgi:hypothetical protein